MRNQHPPPGAAYADADVLATVDGEPAVTWYDVYYYYRYAAAITPQAEITAKEVTDTVDTLATGEVILREAEGKGYVGEENVRKDFAGYRRKLLREMPGEALARETTVAEDEVRSAYEKDTARRTCSVIAIQKREDAEAAYAELEAGWPWAEVVRKYHVREEEKERAGAQSMPLFVAAREAARAAYATQMKFRAQR